MRSGVVRAGPSMPTGQHGISDDRGMLHAPNKCTAPVKLSIMALAGAFLEGSMSTTMPSSVPPADRKAGWGPSRPCCGGGSRRISGPLGRLDSVAHRRLVASS